jgi:hypothetical protein
MRFMSSMRSRSLSFPVGITVHGALEPLHYSRVDQGGDSILVRFIVANSSCNKIQQMKYEPYLIQQRMYFVKGL